MNKDLTPGEANATPGSAMPSSMNIAEQESNIGRQIHRLDPDLSDAESYEANGREEWGKGDTSAAQRDFRIAQHILRMATGGKAIAYFRRRESAAAAGDGRKCDRADAKEWRQYE